MLQVNRFYQADCIGRYGMEMLQPKSVALIIADLPYGKTRNEWDKIINPELLWEHFERVIKDNGVIALTGTFDFLSMMEKEATVPYRYDIVWKKNRSTGHYNANRQQLRQHELVLIFYKKQPVYHPQKTEGHRPVNKFYTRHSGANYGKSKVVAGGGQTDRYPTSVWEISVVSNSNGRRLNPTEKPVELYERLIRTYTNPGDLCFDPTCGSGVIGEAALLSKRDFIGMDIRAEACREASERIDELLTMNCS